MSQNYDNAMSPAISSSAISSPIEISSNNSHSLIYSNYEIQNLAV